MAQRRVGVRLVWAVAAVVTAGAIVAAGAARTPDDGLDRDARRWVKKTLAHMSLDEKIGQMLVPSFESTFIASDSDAYDRLVHLVRDDHVGGFHVFGGSRPTPGVLLNAGYSSVTLGDPFEAASVLNRLQAIASIPLLNTADFEAGVGFRLAGATVFPRNMAFGAAGDEQLAFDAGRVTALEGRAVGVHVDFAPVVDVNDNPRNPVINTRSFGEDPAAVARLGAAYVRGLQSGGMLATLKHFPGHGNTDVDSHLGLPIIREPRAELDQVELVPFRAGIAAGADAVMIAHIEMPALDPAPETPATLSRPIVTGLLRGELGFDGLVYTDSMSMDAVTKMLPPGEAAVRAVEAGNDVVLHSPDDDAALAAIKAAVEKGEIPAARIDASVGRILRAKARLGLYRTKAVDLERLPAMVGGREHRRVAEEVSQRSLTLVKDDRNQVPLRVGRDAHVLYLSVLDYPSGWGIAAPSRTFTKGLRDRWPDVTAVELSDRTSRDELDLVRAMAPRYDAIVASVFVRTASYSGRMDLAPPVAQLLRDLVPMTEASGAPYVAVLFGNPYVATFLPELPAILLTYDYYDLPERSAVRALAGEAPIEGRLPIALPGLFPLGEGLMRPGRE
jgi:beta-glucosidase-like glycosyl hydrolase